MCIDEIAVVISIVEFVQLCFEGHYVELQAYLNIQGDVDRPISLLVEDRCCFRQFQLGISTYDALCEQEMAEAALKRDCT